jgi:hypothetical protein
LNNRIVFSTRLFTDRGWMFFISHQNNTGSRHGPS